MSTCSATARRRELTKLTQSKYDIVLLRKSSSSNHGILTDAGSVSYLNFFVILCCRWHCRPIILRIFKSSHSTHLDSVANVTLQTLWVPSVIVRLMMRLRSSTDLCCAINATKSPSLSLETTLRYVIANCEHFLIRKSWYDTCHFLAQKPMFWSTRVKYH